MHRCFWINEELESKLDKLSRNNSCSKSKIMNDAELLEEEADRILVTEDVLFFLINLLETHHKGDLEGKLLLILSGLSSGFQDKRKTIHVITVGGSGKGKSHLQEAVSYLFEIVDNINSTSAKALLYRT